MQITKYKNIEDLIVKKEEYLGRELEKRDLSLIDKGYAPTSFNIGINDVMEFALYDSANNVLEQDTYGAIRYIKGSSIAEYLIRSENIDDKTSGGGFLIDIKRLVKEAGYNTGYFRVQVNFSNNRVGSDYPKDKLWIQEISPSKKEVRLLPFNNFDESNKIDLDIKNDLNQAYDSFVRGKFSGDEVYSEIDGILDSLNESDITNMLYTIFSSNFVEGMQKEFGISSMQSFYGKVLTDMRKAIRYHLLYRDSTIGSNKFGKPLSDVARNKISTIDYNYYTKEDIINLLNSKFRESVAYHLPDRNLNEKLTLTPETVASLDALNKVVQTLNSTTQFGIPAIEKELYTPPPAIAPEAVTPVNQPIIYEEPKEVNPPLVTDAASSNVLQFASYPTAYNITQISANINWTTNIPTNGKISFLGNCPVDGCVISFSDYLEKHLTVVSGLTPNTTYTFNLQCVSETGARLEVVTYTFTTLNYNNQQTVDSSTPKYTTNDTTAYAPEDIGGETYYNNPISPYTYDLIGEKPRTNIDYQE